MKPVYYLCVIALLLLCLPLSACGQKGPLYLPDDENKVEEAEKKTVKEK